MYLSPEKFFEIYPLTTVLTHGTYGIIYRSGDYIVKYQSVEASPSDTPIPLEVMFNSIIAELNLYSRVSHPNIARVEAWTFVLDVQARRGSYIAIRRGILLHKAIQKGMISLRQAVRDVISAVAFLNVNGICHGDIKDANIIYDNGVKLIDFGLSRTAVLFEPSSPFPRPTYYMRGISYSEWYRDPEYVPGEFNPITSEMYSIARLIYFLSCQERGISSNKVYDQMDESFEVPSVEDIELDRITQLCTVCPIALRPPIDYLCLKFKIPIGGQLIDPTSPDNKCKDIMLTLRDWLIPNCVEMEFHIRTTFLCINLMSRCLPKLYGPDLDLCLLGFGCAYIACAVCETYIIPLVEPGEDRELIFEMLVQILQATEGIITVPTKWDYAQFAEDIPQLLLDEIQQADEVRVLSSTGSSKYITTEKALKIPFKSLPNSKRDYYIQPTKGFVKYTQKSQFLSSISKEIGRKKIDPDVFRKVLRFRSWLPQLPFLDAVRVYNTLKRHSRGREILFSIANFDPKREVRFRSLGLHPFRVSNREIDLAEEEVCPPEWLFEISR